MSALHLVSSSRRTGAPRLRFLMDFFTSLIKSSASSSISRSELRVMRKGQAATMLWSSNSSSRLWIITSSSKVNCRPSLAGSSKNRGRIEGTCTMAKTFSSLSLLCSLLFRHTAMFKDLLASRGKGRLPSTARGVSTGKSTFWKYWER